MTEVEDLNGIDNQAYRQVKDSPRIGWQSHGSFRRLEHSFL